MTDRRVRRLLAALLAIGLWTGCGSESEPEPQEPAHASQEQPPVAETTPGTSSQPIPDASGADTGDNIQPLRSGPNRLIHEKSPYLLQHAHNPVDWYPWGEEALARAAQENKPIFLSIGYSTCHWCHVMAHESFEDPAVAAVLNDNYISIKLDREERPDIDRIYMSFVQATSGRGGWPLNVFLTPDRKPFLGGTYFPPKRAGDRPGFIEILQIVSQKWTTDQATLIKSADQIVDQLRAQSQLQNRNQGGAVQLSNASMATAAKQLKERFDPVYGGFGRAPKFPRPAELLFLHRQYVRTGDAELLKMSLATLDALARGGIRDHLAGGFHRYSTDAFWREPHYEKMLYDQSQLVIAFLEAYQLSGEKRFAETARSTLEYVLRDMRHADGGFYSAEDADSAEDPKHPDHKIEGAFYVWSHADLQATLSPELMQLAVAYYGLEPGGNLRGSELRGKNSLYIDRPLTQVADSLGLDAAAAEARLADLHETLLKLRAERLRPHLDDKVLTSWNGLMISAFARAAQTLGEERYQKVAEQAADFVLKELWDEKNQQLLRRWRLGDAAIAAFNVDYAFLVQACLDLYETSFDYKWLQTARSLTERQIVLFADPEAGAFFDVTDADSSVIFRTKEFYDGAQPTSNSVTALNLLRLAEITDSEKYRALGQGLLEYYAVPLDASPLALPSMLIALDWKLGSPQQIIIAGVANATDTNRLLRAVHDRFLPTSIVLLADGGEAQAKLSSDLPALASMGPIDGKATAFVCENYACQLPVTTAQELGKQLDSRN